MTAADIQQQLEYHSGEILKLAKMIPTQPKKQKVDSGMIAVENYIKNSQLRKKK